MLRRRAALTACVTLIAGAITSIGVSTPAQAAPPTCDAVTAWSDLQVCFDTATGTTGNPTAVTLAGDITAGSDQYLAVPAGKAITLDLAGHNLTITTPSAGNAAISVPDGTALTINNTDTTTPSTATLTATGGEAAAGIGGGPNGDGGTITINGGTTTATSAYGGAGIGGGSNGDGGTITINGGTTTATGGEAAAGIGGGPNGSGGAVEIAASASVTAANGAHAPTAIGNGLFGESFGSLTNAGKLTIPTGSKLTIPAGTTVPNNGTITGPGSITGPGTVAVNNYPLTFDQGTTDFGTTTTPDQRVYAPTLTAAGITLPQPETGNNGTWTYTPATGPDADTPVEVTPTTDLNTLFGDNPTSARTLTFVPGTCTPTTWADLKACFDTATGTPAGNPTHITLGSDLTAPSSQNLAVSNGKAITLDLAGHDLTITNPGVNRPGIYAAQGAAFTIDNTAPRTATLTATGGDWAAGIGGNNQLSGGTITINGGTINATGGRYGPGIGGGYEGDGGTITIGADATVTAHSGPDAPTAIGHSYGSSDFGSLSNAGTLTIATGSTLAIPTGATVSNTGSILGAVTGTVTVNNYPLTFDQGTTDFGTTTTPDQRVYAPTLTAAGITLPQPETGNTGTWTYTPTTGPDADTPVEVTPTTNLNSLFGNNPSSARTLAFTPGVCTATTWTDLKACFDGATGTPDGNPTHITLGATITAGANQSLTVPAGKAITLDLAGHNLTIATPGDNRAAIHVHSGRALTINDTSDPSTGTLTVVGGLNGSAGIGSTNNVDGGTITINSGTITATGGPGAPGIGGGAYKNGGTITINGGTITATGGVRASGIGGGLGGSGGTVTIAAGAIVTAKNGTIAPTAIGHGDGGADFGSLSNAGHLTIPTGATLAIPTSTTVTNNGTITNHGAITNDGTLTGTGTITNRGIIKGTGTIPGNGHGGTPFGTALLVTGHHYDLEFDLAGTGLDPIDPIHLYASTITAGGHSLPTPTRTGYAFQGWYVGATQVTNTTPLSEPGPVTATLTPQFSKTQTVAWPTLPTDPKVGQTWTPEFTTDTGDNPATITASTASGKDACTVDSGVVTFTQAGGCELTATRPGDDTHTEATATVELTITKTTPTFTLSPSTTTPVYGGPLSVVITQNVAIPGTVSYRVGHLVSASETSINGTVTLPLPSLDVGTYTAEIVFKPTDTTTYASVTPTMPITVAAADTTTRVTLNGTTLTATVSPVAPSTATPTGNVDFTLAGQAIGTATLNHNGVATLAYAVPAGQTQQVGAIYTGTSTHTGSSASTARTNPRITARITPAATSNSWHRGPLTITYTCTPTTAPLTQACPAPVTIKAQGRGIATTRTITATDGGIATITTRVNIDTSAPRITVTKKRRANGSLKVTCTATDTLSGVARTAKACTVTTRTRGTTVRWTAKATDNAGNTTTRTGKSQRHKAWLVGVRWKNGRQVVSTGHSYTLTVTSKTRPTYYNAAISPHRPHVKGPQFRRTGKNTWAITITINPAMANHKKWNLGIKTGPTMRILPITVTR